MVRSGGLSKSPHKFTASSHFRRVWTSLRVFLLAIRASHQTLVEADSFILTDSQVVRTVFPALRFRQDDPRPSTHLMPLPT
jgi:hypothetical protein